MLNDTHAQLSLTAPPRRHTRTSKSRKQISRLAADSIRFDSIRFDSIRSLAAAGDNHHRDHTPTRVLTGRPLVALLG